MTGPYGDSTRSVKAVGAEAVPGQPVAATPVPAAAYHIPPSEDDSLDSYGRYHNPTWRQLESALAELEGATAALTFGSGMAAITSVLRALTKPGTTLVVPADGYYQVRRYAVEYLAPQGITVIEAKCADIIDAASGADVVLAETPSNPGLDVVDLHALAMTCRGHGATLIVDNTTATPFGQQPLSLGADLVVASATKTLSGHHDLLAGYVAGCHVDQMAAIEHERRLAGPILGAFEAWMVLRSIATAGLRFERQCQNASRDGVDVARTSGRAIRAVPGPDRRPVARGRQPADEPLRRDRRDRARERRRRSSVRTEQQPVRLLDQLRRYPQFGGPHGPAGATRSARASPASPQASRTPTT